MGTKKKQGILAAITSILLVAVVVLGVVVNDAESKFITIEDLLTPLAGGPVLVQQTDADINVIPDKYNTGCKGELTKVTGATTINGITVKVSGGYFVIDFAYANAKAEGDYVFKDIDFTKYNLSINNEAKVSGKKISVTFDNCKFARVKNAYPKSEVFSYTFNDCSLMGFAGSNATFNCCQFGHSYVDCMNPYQNVYVNKCYFADLTSTDPASAGVHSDGVQIYAHKDTMAQGIFFDRCRFEVPAIQTTGDTAAVNACISVSLEYNDADNIHVTNCIVNGGGYTFYAQSKNGNNLLTDISFDNIQVGYSKLFGTFYPNIDPNVSINNVVDQSSLYVSSVWKETGETHIIVTNDTSVERVMKVVTGTKEYTFSIKPSYGGKDLRYNHFDMPFSDFPIDMDIVIPEDASYIVCYDATNDTETQIRFVNWSGEQVLLGGVIDNKPEEKAEPTKKPKNEKKTSRNDAKKPVLDSVSEVEDSNPDNIEEIVADESEPICGVCGSNASFVLSSDGVLTISGSGKMSNFDSSKPSPWNDKIGNIQKIIVEDGITSIGTQSFRKAINLCEVTLSDSVSEISNNAFQGCTKLTSITIGKSVTAIGRYAFSGTSLSSASYLGTEEQWNYITIGEYNEPLVGCISFLIQEDIQNTEESDYIMEGSCGADVFFTLSADGVLDIYGTGDMNNYDSSKPAPWSNNMNEIGKIVIEDGVTCIGNQSFRKASNLTTVSIPDSVVAVKNNAFQGCNSLSTISLGKNITSIGKYAFSGTGLVSARYEGSKEEFNQVSVGNFNESLLSILSFSE